jgi:hypothetical protein
VDPDRVRALDPPEQLFVELDAEVGVEAALQGIWLPPSARVSSIFSASCAFERRYPSFDGRSR